MSAAAVAPATGNNASTWGSLTTPWNIGMMQYDPGYQFTLQQGTQALQAQQAAEGNYLSPGASNELLNYVYGLSSQEAQQAFTNYNTQQQMYYNMLMGVSNQGLGAGQSLAGVASNAANTMGNTISNIGQAQGSSAMGTANSWGSLGSLLGAAGGAGLGYSLGGTAASTGIGALLGGLL